MQNSDNCIWKSRPALSTKQQLYNTCILAIMLYGSECWAQSNADTNKIDALKNGVLQGSLIYSLISVTSPRVQSWSVANNWQPPLTSATWREWMSQQMPEFLQQFSRVVGKGQQDVLTLSGWPPCRATYHITTSVWKMPPSWHWTGHSGGYWQQAGLCTELLQAKQWW